MKKTNKPITYAVIVLIALVAALNYEIFIFPNEFAPAGLPGLETMIQQKWGFPMSTMNVLINVLHALADYYDTSIDYLLGRTPEKKPYPKR